MKPSFFFGAWCVPCVLLPLVLCLLLTLPMSVYAESSDKSSYPTTWFVLPTVSYDTDNGLAFGGVTGAVIQKDKEQGPLHRFFAQGKTSLTGYHSHRILYDLEKFGTEGRFGFGLYAEFKKWEKAEYFGIGNALIRQKNPIADPKPNESYEAFGHLRPTLKARVDVRVRDELRGYAGIAATYNRITVYSNTLLEQNAPLGTNGGLSVELFGGLIWDTRADPTSDGVFLEFGMRTTLPLPAKYRNGQYAGLHANAQAFWRVHPDIRLLTRMMGDWLLGEPSFDAMNEWGGFKSVSGFGGGESIRGPLFGRWRGPGKVLWNAEAHFHLGDWTALDTHLGFGMVSFLDVGMIFDVPDEPLNDFLFAPFHPATGLGARITFDNTFVLRIDFGVGIDPREGGDGESINDPSYGFYILAGEMF
jgi:hypothetical protein